MNQFQIVENLYTNKSGSWIVSLDESVIQPFLIQRVLAMNDAIRVQVRWLDKYVFTLPPKMYLSLAWSVLPKYNKPPYVKYIKKAEESEEFEFILSSVRKHFEMSDNDYKAIKNRLVNTIKDDMPSWFKAYGVKKTYWKQYYLNFKGMKESEGEKKKETSLSDWGL